MLENFIIEDKQAEKTHLLPNANQTEIDAENQKTTCKEIIENRTRGSLK